MDKKKLFEGLMLYLKLRYKDENDIQIRYLMVGGQIDNTDTEGYTIPSNFLGFLSKFRAILIPSLQFSTFITGIFL